MNPTQNSYSRINYRVDQYPSPRGQFTQAFRPRYTTGTRNISSKEYPGHNVPSMEHWCETCDRDFPTMRLLEEHRAQHQKCNIDGCQFIAHPKVVTKHIQMQHSTGLYRKISNLNNPEEIQKWREERKKKYPTHSNIEKKAAEIKEKITRGEKLGLKADRFAQRNNRSDFKKRCNAYPYERPHRDNKKNIKNPNTMQRVNTSREKIKMDKKRPPPNIITAQEDSNKLKPFAGIQDLIMDSDDEIPEPQETNFLIEDDDIGDETLPETKLKPESSTTVCGALTNLMCNYGTSDEDEPDHSKVDPGSGTKIETHKTIETKIQPESQTVSCLSQNNKHEELEKHNASEDDEAPDEVKTNNTDPNGDATNSAKVQLHQKLLKHTTKVNLRARRQVNQRFRPKPPSTLLQKLLFREMRQERNMVLQCVRHIVQNNFFDKE